ncbi:MAG TPA: hypothetical protein VFU02_23415, partial [Polyangiaceae bacterium]|nr:hypothetical protein [Polyangiaceae bacterium]
LWRIDIHTERAERVPPILLREAPVGTLMAYSVEPTAARVVVPSATRLVLHPGHVTGVYRPPRA